MLSRVLNMFRVADLRNKIIFTLAIIGLYRLGSFVPAPGVDVEAVQGLRDTANQGGILAYMQLFSGGALTQFAVFALGIMPYITSSIIMQILGVVIPKIEQWQQQGAVGQRKITQWTRYLTVSIAVVQSTSFAFLFHNGSLVGGADLLPDFNAWTVFVVVLTLTSGTALLMWMGELITQRGVGNGMSLLIFTSVVSSLPAQGALVKEENSTAALVALIFVAVALLVAIVFVEQGQRRIPVQFAKRVVGRRMYGGQSTYIPLKVNQSGVIPIIFASSVLYLPNLIAVALPDEGFGGSVQRWVDSNLAAEIVCRDALHGIAACAVFEVPAAGTRPGHGRLGSELRRHDQRTGRPARALAQPVAQWHDRNRCRPVDRCAAAQSQRGRERTHPPDR